jgi:integrase
MAKRHLKGKETLRVGDGIGDVHISRIFKRGKERFQVEWYEGGERRRRSRSTLEEIRRCADEIGNNLKQGDQEANTFTGSEKLQYQKAMGALEGTGYTLVDAVKAFAKSHKTLGERGTIPDAVDYFMTYCPEDRRIVTVSEAVAGFLEYKQQEIDPKSFRDYRCRLTEMADVFDCNLENVTEKNLRTWIESLTVKEEKNGMGKMGDPISNQTRRGYLAKIHALFKWAKKNNYLPPTLSAAESLSQVVKARNSRIWFVPRGSAAIMTVKQADALVRGVRDDNRAYTALLLFAGLRPSECLRLLWEHIDFDTGHIEIIPEVARKVGADRYVPLEDNLRQWLEPYRKESGSIAYKTANTMLTGEAVKKLKIFPSWIGDIPRHSYASYRLAIFPDKPKLAEYMGNSVKVINKHYRRPVLEEAGRAYFSIVPQA